MNTPPEPPTNPPTAAEGCLSMLMFLAGIVLLLPAACALLGLGRGGFDSSFIGFWLAVSAIGFVGAWLIWLATRPRSQ
ncbi:hypothetical protein [Bradyrhizobium viridifuturi]|uniref:hypothetical protein n=1 Tax=Bradyrhizobium viridifuturi TaxID=1654716 RepID=UPI00067F549F|nr:hypothetical protein [Bradyrhizobium viridifuturi]